MSFEDRHHSTAKIVTDSFSIDHDNAVAGVTTGTSLTGGFHEYYSLSNITYNPNDPSPTPVPGLLINLENLIPVSFIPASTTTTSSKKGGSVTITTPDSLELNSDLMSSGRLKLGMVVYVIEKQQAYQFIINDYKTLYNAAASNITKSVTSATVTGGSTESDALIDAWTIHKVEGEDDGNGGTWTRDQANWRKYPNEEEYFAINNVPASEPIDDFNFEDAIIVVPPSWNNKKVLSVTSSIFTMSSNAQSTITLNQTAPDGTASTKNWTHGANSKNATGDFSVAPLSLVEGATLHLSQTPKFGAGNLGYTATFKVKG